MMKWKNFAIALLLGFLAAGIFAGGCDEHKQMCFDKGNPSGCEEYR